jgi:dihydrofolate synthase/folylpolyglutamate synthase
MADELAPLFDEIIITRSSHPRSMDVLTLAVGFENCGIEVESANTIAEALELAVSRTQGNGLICVTGSLFVVGDAIAHFTAD